MEKEYYLNHHIGLALVAINSGDPGEQTLQNYVAKPYAFSECNIMQDSSTCMMSPLKINGLLTFEVIYTDCECLHWQLLDHLRHLLAISLQFLNCIEECQPFWIFTDRLVLFIEFAHTSQGP